MIPNKLRSVNIRFKHDYGGLSKYFLIWRLQNQEDWFLGAMDTSTQSEKHENDDFPGFTKVKSKDADPQ